MDKINTIEALAKALDEGRESERSQIVSRLDLSPEAFEAFATWSEEGYTRNCVARTDDYELLLLCWDQQAETPIHGHGGQDCWVYQIEGTVEEIRVKEDENDELQETHRMDLAPGKISYMNDDMGYHKIRNPFRQRAMTLHIYAKPIDACKVFDPENEAFEVKEMEYDTVADIA
ncbi:MAG: cysteine dioxygenase [Bacteroidota bacterium]